MSKMLVDKILECGSLAILEIPVLALMYLGYPLGMLQALPNVDASKEELQEVGSRHRRTWLGRAKHTWKLENSKGIHSTSPHLSTSSWEASWNNTTRVHHVTDIC